MVSLVLEPFCLSHFESSAVTLIARCHECGARYRVADERANKRVKCKKCETIFQVPPLDEPEKAPDGTNVFIHEHRDRDFELASGNEKNIQAISDHIEAHVGPVEMVFHELISDLVHIDVHWVKPSKRRPFHTLITSGMSDRPMTVPDEIIELQFAELAITLPPDWKLTKEDFKDENWYWPIRTMKMLARLPHEFETWLGIGHTVPNGDPAEPYAPGTKQCCALIMPPVFFDEEFETLDLEDGSTIHFYSIMPLYEEEMNFKLSKGLEELIDRFEKYDIGDVVEMNRKNTCRRKRFGLF